LQIKWDYQKKKNLSDLQAAVQMSRKQITNFVTINKEQAQFSSNVVGMLLIQLNIYLMNPCRIHLHTLQWGIHKTTP
jgi:hypothetical protein